MRPVLAAVVLVLLGAAEPAHAVRLLLVVTASAEDPDQIAQKARELSGSFPDGLVVTTADCGASVPVFAFAAGVTPSREKGEALLGQARRIVRDAYIKACDTTPGSLLSLRIDAVDATIASVPRHAVTWDDAARVSSAIPLSADVSFVVVRRFVADRNDPFEGQRQRALLAKADGRRIVLEENCLDSSRPVPSEGLIAFDCVREQAGAQLLHETLVVTEEGRNVQRVARCRKPRWAGPRRLECEAEEVTASGKLVLRRQQITVETR